MKIKEITHPGERAELAFVDSEGCILDSAQSVRDLRLLLGLETAAQLANALRYFSRRTVEGWEQGRKPTYLAMLALQDLLTAHERKAKASAKK